jgi:hypothetical protein
VNWKNIAIIGLLVLLLFMFYNSNAEIDRYAEPTRKYQDLPVYQSEIEDWGSFAQAIKTETITKSGKTGEMDIFNENVDIVRGFFKTYDVKPTGWHVKILKDEINKYIRNGGKKHFEI